MPSGLFVAFHTVRRVVERCASAAAHRRPIDGVLAHASYAWFGYSLAGALRLVRAVSVALGDRSRRLLRSPWCKCSSSSCCLGAFPRPSAGCMQPAWRRVLAALITILTWAVFSPRRDQADTGRWLRRSIASCGRWAVRPWASRSTGSWPSGVKDVCDAAAATGLIAIPFFSYGRWRLISTHRHMAVSGSARGLCSDEHAAAAGHSACMAGII